VTLTFDCLSAPQELKALRGEWNDLLATNHTNEVFLTWEWQTTWFNTYQPGDLYVIIARDESGRLVGIAPWFIDGEGRVLRPIGCVDVTDYLDLIVRPDHRPAVFSGFAAHLAQNRTLFSRVNLCNHPDGSPALTTFAEALRAAGFTVTLVPQEVCPVIPLPATFEDYLNGLDKKNRHELRRKLRRAGAEEEGVAWHIVGAGDDLPAAIETFTALMAASSPQKADFLADAKNGAFFRAIVPQIAACGWLQLSFLTVEGTPAAAYLNFDYDNRILVYNSGLIPVTYGHLSPGIVLLAHLIEDAISKGRRAFDFLRGNEDYKYRMGGVDKPVYEIKAD